MTKMVLTNGRVIDPANQLDEITNLYIADGKIVACASRFADFEPEIVVNAKDKIICPGIVDLQANILQSVQGLQAFSDYLQRALEIGITSVGIPAFLNNRCLEATEIRYLTGITHSKQSAKPYFIGPLTQNLQGDRLAELMLLKEAGCIGFSNGFSPIDTLLTKHRCYDYAASFQLKVFIHPQDFFLSPRGGMHEGEVSARLGLPGIPALAETVALAQEFSLIESTKIAAHCFHLTCAQSLPLLEMSIAQGLCVTADASISHLYLTDLDICLNNGLGNIQPPLRSSTDKDSLRNALKKGLLKSIASAHISLAKEAKEVPFQNSQPGIASWPLLLPLTLRLAREEQIPLSQMIDAITHQPAKILGINAGHLSPGGVADVLVFDPNEEWTLVEENLNDFGFNSPFRNWLLCGRVKYTIVNGQIGYYDKICKI